MKIIILFLIIICFAPFSCVINSINVSQKVAGNCMGFKDTLQKHIFKGMSVFNSQKDSTYITDVPLDSFVRENKHCFQQLTETDLQALFPPCKHFNPSYTDPMTHTSTTDTFCIFSFRYIYLLPSRRGLDTKTMTLKHPIGYELYIQYDCKTKKIIQIIVPEVEGLRQ